jgi:hypothetical protein
MNQIINSLGGGERFIQAITGLISFGVFKFIVVPILKDLNEKRKEYFKKPAAIPTPPPANPTTVPVSRPEPEPPAVISQR